MKNTISHKHKKSLPLAHMYNPMENCQPVFKKVIKLCWAVHALQLHVICSPGQPMPNSISWPYYSHNGWHNFYNVRTPVLSAQVHHIILIEIIIIIHLRHSYFSSEVCYSQCKVLNWIDKLYTGIEYGALSKISSCHVCCNK